MAATPRSEIKKDIDSGDLRILFCLCLPCVVKGRTTTTSSDSFIRWSCRSTELKPLNASRNPTNCHSSERKWARTTARKYFAVQTPFQPHIYIYLHCVMIHDATTCRDQESDAAAWVVHLRGYKLILNSELFDMCWWYIAIPCWCTNIRSPWPPTTVTVQALKRQGYIRNIR